RLDEPRRVGIILQSLPNLADRRVDAVIGIEENIFAPDPAHYLVTLNNLPCPFDQQQKHGGRNTFKLEDTTASAQLVAAGVELDSLAQINPLLRLEGFQRHCD